MQEAVSQILDERAHEADGIGRMVGLSVLAHAALAALVVLLPSGWLSPSRPPEGPIMTISLGGAPGPEIAGRTQISGRTAQVQREPDAKPAPEPPPIAKVPEMVAPSPAAKPAPRTPEKPVEKPVDRSTSKTPTTGREVATGASKVDTGAKPVPFGGLASGGGGDTSGARTDYANFCCPEYLRTMTDLIRRNWQRNQGASGVTHMKFTVQRDGRITGIAVEKPSGQALLDLASQRALTTVRLPALPREFPEQTLTVYLAFEYNR